MRSHDAILLAAGRSRRLGQPKALITRAGKSQLQRVTEVLLASGARQLVVVISPALAEVAARLLPSTVTVCSNPQPEAGRLGSLHRGLACLSDPAPRVLLSLVDQPALDLAHLQQLLSLAADGAAVCDYGDGRGPPAVWPTAWLRELPASGDGGLGRLLAADPSRQIAVMAAPELGLDLDTPEDLARARGLGLIDP